MVKDMNLDFFRVSAGSGIVGGVLAIIFNLLHPRSSDAIHGGAAQLEMVAKSGIWRLDHIMLGLATVLIFLGVIGIAASMFGTAADTWARAWLIFSGVSVTLLLITLALDGAPLKGLADQWASGGRDPATFAAANVLTEITSGLLVASIALLFGVAPLLLGVAVLSGGGYPRLLGQAALAGGAIGLLDALVFAFQGFTTLSILILFTIASLTSTAVLLWASWELWKRSQAVPRATSNASVRTEEDTTVTPGLL